MIELKGQQKYIVKSIYGCYWIIVDFFVLYASLKFCKFMLWYGSAQNLCGRWTPTIINLTDSTSV